MQEKNCNSTDVVIIIVKNESFFFFLSKLNLGFGNERKKKKKIHTSYARYATDGGTHNG